MPVARLYMAPIVFWYWSRRASTSAAVCMLTSINTASVVEKIGSGVPALKLALKIGISGRALVTSLAGWVAIVAFLTCSLEVLIRVARLCCSGVIHSPLSITVDVAVAGAAA